MGESNTDLKSESKAVDKALNGLFNVAEIFQNTGIDQDKNEKIKRTEIFSAISTPEITGDNAAGLATMRQQFKDIRGLSSTDGDNRDITKTDLRKLTALGDLKAMKMIADGKTILPALDTNSDTRLSKKELEQAALQLDNGASKRGIQAMLKNFEIIGGTDAETISPRQIKDFVAKRMTAQQETTIDKIAKEFGERKTRLDESNRQPFKDIVPFLSVKGDAPTQGIAGDCWLISATSSLCEKNPWAVDKLMKENKDGTITVKFPYVHEGNNLEATIAKPTDSELALYATTGKYGTYGAILEKALGTIMDKNPELKGTLTSVERDRGKGTPVQELLGGSKAPFAIELLTGQKAKSVDLNSLTTDQMHHILSWSWNSVATCDSDGDWPKQRNQPVKPIGNLPKRGGIGGVNEIPKGPEREPRDLSPLEELLQSDTPTSVRESEEKLDSDRPKIDRPEQPKERPALVPEMPGLVPKPDQPPKPRPDLPPSPRPDLPPKPHPDQPPKPHPSDQINEDEDKEEEKKPSAHEFAILKYNQQKRIVTVRNPWGTGELVGKDGKPLDGQNDGKMELTLEEFAKYFHRMSLPESVINRGLLSDEHYRRSRK